MRDWGAVTERARRAQDVSAAGRSKVSKMG